MDGMIRSDAVVRLIVVVAVVLAMLGCSRKSCLRGECEAASACDQVTFECEPGELYVGRVADADAAVRLVRGEGADDDTLLTNGVVTVVLDAIDAPHDLAPTGGNVIDLGPAGGADDVNIVYQIAGILPDDAFAYESLETIDEADHVAVIARGHLDGRPEIAVVTRYELRPCDPGVRVRSELFNDSPDVQAYVLADVPHWGKRRVVPFGPVDGQGYLAPELDLLELSSLYESYDYTAAAATLPDSPGYAVAACNQVQLDGINDLELSAWGTPMQLVRPGASLVLERFWTATGAGQGPGPAIEVALGVRAQVDGSGATLGVGGTITAQGLPFGGDARRASVIVYADDTPLSAVVPDADGVFRAAVPLRAGLRYEVWSFGRVVASGDVADTGDVGTIDLAPPAILQVTVSEPYAQVVLIPSDDATRDDVRGTFHGRFDVCAPWLGPPHGGSPACNRIVVDPAGVEVEVPAGTYDIYATAGPDFTLARQAGVALVGGEITTLDFTLDRLDLVPAGWLRADLHVHGRGSFDSSIPDLDRVRSFLAAGIEVIAATDHDRISDYAETVAALGVGDRVRVLGGAEMTQVIPWMKVDGSDFPRVIGHFNFWPLVPDPSQPRAGAPSDEGLEPGPLFDLMRPLIGPDGVAMINHPLGESVSGRDIGYLRAIGFDPRVPVTELVERNHGWDVMEVINGAGVAEVTRTRPAWFALLSQGHVVAGAANSDSHGLTDAHLGWGRTLVDAQLDLADFDDVTFDRAVKDGRTTGGTGIVIVATITDAGGNAKRGLGFEPYEPAAGDLLAIEVRAAPWIPVTDVHLVTSTGEIEVASGADLVTPADPFGTDDTVRVQITVPIATIVTGADDWFVIEAGMPLPVVGDLDDDGIPDTSDNDGDGDVDADDVEDGEDDGPLAEPVDPTDDTDPRYHLTRVVPGAWPYAFTSPILVDVNGDGWDPPGLP